MRAKYPGECTACGGPIRVDDFIMADLTVLIARNGLAAWRHITCPAEAVHGTPCPRCRLERALDGSCECDS